VTGYFVLIHRDGRYQHVQVDQCTDEELEEVFDCCTDAPLLSAWAIALAQWIRDNVQEEPATAAEAAPEVGLGF